MIYYYDFKYQVDLDRLYKRLKIDPLDPNSVYVKDMIIGIARIMQQRIVVKEMYGIREAVHPIGIADVDSCGKQVVCLVYLDGIMKVMTELEERGDYFEAYVADIVATDALFKGSDHMNQRICEQMKREGLNLTKRNSPGEDGVNLSLQRDLLAMLREEADVSIPVEMKESYMLVPEKSMLYVFGADKNLPEIAVEHDCSKCANVNCSYRVEN